MRAGEIDGASTVPLDQADQWMDIAGIHMQFARNHQVAYFGFNTEAKPFDDVRVRRAFAYCLDKAGLVNSLLGGHGSPAPALIPPEFFDVVQSRARQKSSTPTFRNMGSTWRKRRLSSRSPPCREGSRPWLNTPIPASRSGLARWR